MKKMLYFMIFKKPSPTWATRRILKMQCDNCNLVGINENYTKTLGFLKKLGAGYANTVQCLLVR